MSQQTSDASIGVALPALPRRRHWLLTLLIRLVTEKPLGAFGVLLIVALFAIAIFAGQIATHNPDFPSAQTLAAPSGEHYFGTDHLGRDVFSRVVYGSRTSIYIGFGAVGITTALALLVGVISGYFGGWIDAAIQRFVDAGMTLPWLVLLLVLVSVISQGLWQLIVVLGVLGMFGSSRVVRASVMGIKSNAYVEAARAIGAGHNRVMVRHIIPNIFAPVMILATVGLGSAILAEAALSFLGFGIPPPTASWGRMLRDARPYMLQAEFLPIFPGLAITFAVFGFNMLGDALRDLLDPRLRTG